MFLKFMQAHGGNKAGDVVRFEDRREADAILALGAGDAAVAIRCLADGSPANVVNVTVVDGAVTKDKM